MILKEIQLRNIRSYAELQPFQFAEGTSLFYGGVGSGKSSLLYAIEFALFGLGELKGPDLLRNGAVEGSVSLAFEEDANEYIVKRKLRRKGNTVSQTDLMIYEGGEWHNYDAVAEMKLRVLEILKLNEKPQPSTSSVIYRYGIFTPQEEIKRIMDAPPEVRLETLRRAFRLEKYATARDNARILLNYLEKVEIKILEKETEGLDQKKSLRDSLVEKIEVNNKKLTELGSQLGKITDNLNTLHEKEKELQNTLKEIEKYQAQIPIVRQQLEQDGKLVKQLKDGLIVLNEESAKFASELKRLQALPKPIDKSEEQLKTALRQLDEEQKVLAIQRGANKKSLENYQMLIDKKVCPTCERAIDNTAVYTEKHNKLQQEANALSVKAKELEEKRGSLDTVLQALMQYYATVQGVPQLQEKIEIWAKRIDEKTTNKQQVDDRLNESQKILGQLEESVRSNLQLLESLNQTRQQIIEQEELRNKKNTDIALLEQENRHLEEDRKQIDDAINKGEAALVKVAAYREAVRYLEQYFVPTVEKVEKMVLQRIHEDFNDAFQRYFSMIIGFTEIETYIDEDFSVIIMQGGYETPYNRLSGGERTSLALAYRLALNQLIRKLGKIEKGVLILDEPTEGLSYTQVLNLREVFDDLDCSQIVLVSHEPQFLGFSDRVSRVDKVNHSSIISTS